MKSLRSVEGVVIYLPVLVFKKNYLINCHKILAQFQ